MSHLEKLNNYIDHLQSEKSATYLLNDAKNEELSRAMKTARDMHVHAVNSKPNPLYVNALEEELLFMNEHGTRFRIRRSWIWRVLPSLGVVAVAVVVSIGILQPEDDRNSRKERTSVTVSQEEISTRNAGEQPLELTPVPVVASSDEFQEFVQTEQQQEFFQITEITLPQRSNTLTQKPALADSVLQTTSR